MLSVVRVFRLSGVNMKPKLGFGEIFLAWTNMTFGTATVLLGLWAFQATITDLDWKMSLYYVFAVAFGSYFIWSGNRKLRAPSQVPVSEADDGKSV